MEIVYAGAAALKFIDVSAKSKYLSGHGIKDLQEARSGPLARDFGKK
jgi:hypothetical protein